jgi:hypothetical protein
MHRFAEGVDLLFQEREQMGMQSGQELFPLADFVQREQREVLLVIIRIRRCSVVVRRSLRCSAVVVTGHELVSHLDQSPVGGGTW